MVDRRHRIPPRKSSPEDARRANRRLLLDLLRAEGPTSRADLARLTGLTPATVSNVTRDLLAEGLLADRGVQSGSVGKPATLLGLEPGARVVVAADLSDADQLLVIEADLAGTVLARHHFPFDGATGDDATDFVADRLGDIVAAADRPVLGVGVGTPGLVDDQGIVRDAAHLAWGKVELATRLGDRLGLPTQVDNDANAAALAEVAFGPTPATDLLLVRVGRGVGAGLVLDGEVRRGVRSAAGEIGHVVVDPEGNPCACGRRGCLETVIGTPGLRAALAATDDPLPVLSAAGRRLGDALAPVVGTLDLHQVVVAGPPELGDEFCTAVAAALEPRLLPALAEHVSVRTSLLGDDAVALGAVAAVLDARLGAG